jgi:DNA-binding ferritin-like protein
LNTRSYAKHKALNKFYVGIIELADDFAEAYQGRIGLIGPIVLQSATKTNNVIEFLEDSLKKVEEMRYKVVEKEDAALQNLIDSIVVLYLSTLYKLKFLA